MMWSLLRASPNSWPLQAICPAGESARAWAMVWGWAGLELVVDRSLHEALQEAQVLQLFPGQALEFGWVS